ncbi:MAG: hypothetical protein LBE24_00720, partial [Methylobacillus sp.]|nr:hypothetical protein [Methylobacillus sp.]
MYLHDKTICNTILDTWTHLKLKHICLLLAGGASLMSITPAQANCVNTSTTIQVTDTTGQPAAGESVVCDALPPNPTAPSTVVTATGNNVSVTILNGAEMAPTTRAIGVFDGSTVLIEAGGILRTIGGNNAHGINLQGNNSTATNNGTITTTGTNSNAMNISGATATSGNTLINNGSILVGGNNAAGIQIVGAPNTTIINTGSITATGTSTATLHAAGVLVANNTSGTSTGTFTNETGGTVSAASAPGVDIQTSGFTVTNRGTIGSGTGTAVQFGSGGNTLILDTGSVLNGDVVTSVTGNTVRLQGTSIEDSNFTGGFQSLVMEGANWTLSGNVAIADTAADALRVDSGVLRFTGSVTNAGGNTINNGGTLRVDGTLGGLTTVANDGTLAGNGTVGNVTFQPGSFYEVEVNPAGLVSTIKSTGAATLNGGTVNVIAGTGSYAPSTQYTILNATGGVNGAFDPVVNSNFAFLAPSLTYDANNVYLTLLLLNNTSFDSVGGTPNQIATGTGIPG